MNAVSGYHSAIFGTPRSRKLKPSFWLALSVAVLLHAGGAYYLIHQRFALAVAETPETPPIIITQDPPKKKPEPPKPTKPSPPPPPTTINVHPTPPADPTIETVPLTPPDEPVTATGPTPPIIDPGPPSAGTGTAPAQPAYVTARWTRFPDSEALLSYYPQRATDDETEGTATLECTVTDASGRVTCVVLSEAPKGYGFGKATVKMVQDKGRVDTTQGDVQIGSKLRTIVKWTLG